jgi:hypothetical protein
MSLLKYKTCFYNVEELTNKLPDDCLRIVISYLTDKEYFEKMVHNILEEHLKLYKCESSLSMTYYTMCCYEGYSNTMYRGNGSKFSINFTTCCFEWIYNENMELIKFEITSRKDYYSSIYICKYSDDDKSEKINVSCLFYWDVSDLYIAVIHSDTTPKENTFLQTELIEKSFVYDLGKGCLQIHN